MDVIQPTLPDGLYPLKQLSTELSYPTARLKSLCSQLQIQIVSKDKTTYISSEAVSVLTKAVQAKKSGDNTKVEVQVEQEVIPPKKVKVMTHKEEAPADLVVASPSALEAPTGTPEQFFMELAKAMRQVETTASPPSALTIQRELKEAVDSGFLLATEQVAQIFGMRKSTISSWKTGHKKYGFVFTKIKEGQTTLWKVGQY